MKTKRIKINVLLIVSAFLLLFTNVVSYILLMSKNKDWKDGLSEVNINTTVVAETLLEHMCYDGDTIPNQMVKQYSPSGRMLWTDNMTDVLKGNKIVMLLSLNSCTSCAKDEIKKLLELSKKIGRDNLVIVADFALHSTGLWSDVFDKDGYYEADKIHLGLRGTRTQESVVVMLTQNARIKTSFVVQPLTSGYTDKFHEYVEDYFKRKK